MLELLRVSKLVAMRWAMVMSCLWCGCGLFAKQIGAQAAQGAVQSLQRTAEDIPKSEQGALAERQGRGLVRGSVDELSRPENMGRLSHLLEESVGAVLSKMTDANLPPGSGGSGSEAADSPLMRMARQAGSGVSQGLWDDLSARVTTACDAPNPLDCLERKTNILARAMTAGVVEELWSRVQWTLLGLAFLAGTVAAWLGRKILDARRPTKALRHNNCSF